MGVYTHTKSEHINILHIQYHKYYVCITLFRTHFGFSVSNFFANHHSISKNLNLKSLYLLFT